MFDKKIRFSIIIPTYNSEKTISRCLISILKQKFCNYEILIVDDESTDNTLNVVNEFLNKYKDRIRVIKNKHSGISIIRNIGIYNSKGEYIIFVDSDDYINVNLLNVLSKYNDDVIKFNVFCSNGSDRFIQPTFISKDGKESLKLFCKNKNIFATPWGYAFKRDLFLNENLLFLKGKTHEDFGLIPLIIMSAKTVSSISYVGYNYIKRIGSITQENAYNKEILRMDDFIEQFMFLISEINKRLENTDYKKVYNDYFMERLYVKFTNFKKNIENYNKYDKVVEKCCEKINTFLMKQKLIYPKFTK